MSKPKTELTGSYEEYFKTISVVLDLFSKLFLVQPTQKILTLLKSSGILNSFPIPVLSEEGESALNVLQECISKNNSLEMIREDYLKLFAGLDNVLAPPYASVFLDENKLLFDKSTLLARSYYKKHQIEVEEFNQVPDDHIGLLLQFLSISCHRISNVIKKNNEQILQILINDVSFILNNLLLSWIQLFEERIKIYSCSNYYVSVVFLSKEMLFLLQLLITHTQKT